MSENLTHRERVMKAINREEPDRIPVDLGSTGNTGITRIAYDRLKAHLGIGGETKVLNKAMQLVDVEEKILTRFDVDTRGIWTRYSSGWQNIVFEDGSYEDEWGVVRYKPASSLYYDIVKSPFKEGLSLGKLDGFRWPDPKEPGRIAGIGEKVGYLRKNTDYAIVLFVAGGFVTTSQYLRGFQGWFEDMALEPELIGELLDRTLNYQKGLAEAAIKAAYGDVDLVHFGDDLGTQNGLMISPETYRKIIKPRQAMLFQTVRNLSHARIFYHSCGSVYDILDDLVEIGVDVLNPVQHNARNMDCDRLKKQFGKKIAFWGGIDTNYALPRGSIDEVRDEVRKRIGILGPGGGFVLNPVHNIQPDVPPENICAMFDAAREYGRYPIST